MKTLGRALLYAIVGIIALPAIYAIGIYAIILGAYAIVTLGALVAAPLAMGLPSSEDMAVWLLYVAIAVIIITLCAGGLRLIWYAARHLIVAARK